MFKIRDKRGVILILTFAIMAILMLIVFTYLFLIDTEMKTIGGQITNNQAFYVADAGIQYAIYRLHYAPNWDENGGINHPIGAGSFIVDVRDMSGGTPPSVYKRITSTGTVEGVSRVVKQDVAVTP